MGGPRFLWPALVLACAVTFESLPAAADDTPVLPRPAALEPAVAFWAMIFRDLETSAGLIHDARDLDVVYDTLHFAPGSSWHAQQRTIDHALARYRQALQRAAAGIRDDPLAARVAASWGAPADAATLRAAAGRVRFQRGQADRFRAGLVRATAWRDFIDQTLAAAGVPAALAALPHVESGFDPTARSHAGAAGMWQFTAATGRRFLRIDHVVDERLEPRAATRAAAALLRHNYQRTGSWPLAITAYNHGLAGVLRARAATGSDDIAVILTRYDGPRFGFASRNFYPAFVAASELDDRAPLEFAVTPSPEDAAELALSTPGYVSVAALAGALGVEPALLRRYNPALQATVWRGSKRVPPGFPLRVPAPAPAADPAALLARLPPRERHDRQLPDLYHEVRPGETLSLIAQRYGASVRELTRLNSLRDPHRIRAGTRLMLPGALAAGGAD